MPRIFTNERDSPVPMKPLRCCGCRQLSATMGLRTFINSLGKGKPMTILYVGIDLAKSVFAIHAVNEAGKPELVRPNVTRTNLLELIASLPPCVIGMEACSGGHHWARQFMVHGHTVRLMAPKFVSPYRLSGKHGKNDAADAAAICEAVQRPNMRFVPIKSLQQQSQLPARGRPDHRHRPAGNDWQRA